MVATPDAANISSGALIPPAAVTHNVDENTRYVPLNFTPDRRRTRGSPDRANGNYAPLARTCCSSSTSNGVPSVASWVTIH